MEAAVVGPYQRITTVHYLAQAGYFVTIYDERRYPAMAIPYANGGQLSASNAEVWNSWRNVYKGIKWLSKADAPLKLIYSLLTSTVGFLSLSATTKC